jgi:hypothetical protein
MTRKKDGRSYITVHDDITNHPKIELLSDTTFRHLIGLWGYCNKLRTDGMIPEQRAKAAGPKAFRELTTELVPDAGPLLELQPDGRYYCHDYLSHQWSKQEIEDRAAIKKANGSKGGRPPKLRACYLLPT